MPNGSDDFIFLGSWRSTVIIAVSIPLAILSPSSASALGETINIMTLGGLVSPLESCG